MDDSFNATEPEDMDWLLDSLHWYGRHLHPPVVLVLCIAGSIGHLFTITTLQTMLNPTNALLISMSCSQVLLCVNFLYSTLFKWASDELCASFFFSHWMARTMHVSVTLSVLLHMAGVFHVVALSIVRYFSLKKLCAANSSVPWFTYPICRRIVVSIFAVVLVIGIPLFFMTIVESSENKNCVGVEYFALSLTSNAVLQSFDFWLFILCAKMGPSIVLCVMTRMILWKLQEIREMSARFATSSRDKQHHRTTRMILTIMFMFIVVELPQGIVAVAAFPRYSAMGDVVEVLTLLTSCVIFALFCSTSGKVRSAVMDTPCIRFLRTADSRIATRLTIRRGDKDKQLLEVVTPELDRANNNYAEV